jgi:hypothetical protein
MPVGYSVILHLTTVDKNIYLCIFMTASVFCTRYIIQNQRSDNQMAEELLNACCHISLNSGFINLRLPGEAQNSLHFRTSNFSWF